VLSARLSRVFGVPITKNLENATITFFDPIIVFDVEY
jgi:hypothetical protein